MSELVLKARRLAERRFAEVKRRYTDENYAVHLEEVARLAREAGLGEEAEAAGWLHDLIEDVEGTHEEIYVELGGSPAAKRVADLAMWMTDPEAYDVELKEKNRDERKLAKREKMKDAPYLAKSLKCCDVISNTRDIATNDPGFARSRYLPEMEKLLVVLVGAHKGLLKRAAESVAAAKAKLGME